MHICYLISSLSNEGPTNVVYNIIKYMDFKRFRVSIITFVPEKNNTRIEEFRKFPIEIYQLSRDSLLSPLKLFKLLKGKVIELNPDALHAHCSRSLYLMCFLPKKYKRIYTIHIYPGFQQIQMLGPIKGRITTLLNHFFAQKCDLPIGCAESVGWQYKKYKGWDIVCVPNGASLPPWKNETSEKNQLRSELGLDINLKYFIFIGRFSQEKNPDVLVDVFSNLRIKGIKLIMLGDGVLWEGLKERANDNVIMKGFTTRVYDYLKASDYYISTSDVEGLSNTILESMSVGLPMVLSDIPSHHEILDNFGEGEVGFVVNQHDTKEVIEAISKVLELDSTNVSQKIRNLYRVKYTAEIMSKGYQTEYEKLLIHVNT